MRNLTRVTLTAGAVAGLALFGALPATAADTGLTVEVTGGELTMTAPESVVLSAAIPGGTAAGTLGALTVTDTRAGVAGWVASISSTDFASTTNIIPLANVSYVPTVSVNTGTVAVAETSATGSGPVQTATGVNGNNSATWSATLNVQVPADALAAVDYTAVLTHSVI